ncbi:nucleotide sugar dehydrogenase [Radiobacillus sp. PE A8.2]|uniref:nucleotide sugar dehydrogenase n=1 Tax=Radiobacillus sp. PE A8.2 TaxID=3380349 RepID=UPI00388D96E6
MELFDKINQRSAKIAIIGLGYVGLPLAVAFAKKAEVIGFDVDEQKIKDYKNGIDPTGDTGTEAIRESPMEFTADESRLTEASLYIVTVPTPINIDKVPDLHYVEAATRTIGRNMSEGAIVVYESTVYPGVTEEICVPILEAESGLSYGADFKVGYSPERINPGDKIHRLDNIIKIVSGMDEETLDTVASIYELIIEAGVYRAESIKIAESAKVIENAQRDINIAFMNELSMLFNKMGVDTQAVLRAAGTKWNFLDFKPGLVGGHCIGIDPYYLTYKAEGTGYHSKIILAGRHVNDAMGKYVASEIIKILVRQKEDMKHLKIGVLGVAYKENCPDIRNSKVIDIINELTEYGITTVVADPVVNAQHVTHEYNLDMVDISELKDANVIVLAVPHAQFASMQSSDFKPHFTTDQKRIFIDIKGFYNKTDFENEGYYYWSL